jgi:hypothetical protein
MHRLGHATSRIQIEYELWPLKAMEGQCGLPLDAAWQCQGISATLTTR